MSVEREQLLDSIARCFARAAVDAVLADPTLLQENAAASDQEQQRRKGLKRGDDTPIRATEAT